MTTGADTSGAGGGAQQSGQTSTQSTQTQGQPTHVTQTNTTGYQSPNGDGSNAQGSQTSSQQSTQSGTQTSTQQSTGQQSTQSGDAKTSSTSGQQTQDGQSQQQQQSSDQQQATEFKVPDAFKEKPWAGKLKSMDDVWKQLDNLDTLVGKKAVVPNLKEATPEAREAFYAEMRPKDLNEYAIPDNPAFLTTDETRSVVRDLFSKNGVSPVQANEIIKGYQELGAKQMAAQFDATAFKTSMETAFGADWEKVTGTVRNSIKGFMNAEDQKMLDNMPNSYLGTIYRTLGNVIKHFGVKETDSAHFQSGGKHAATNINDVRQGLRNELAALSMRPHTAMEQQAIIEKLNATYTNDPRLQQQG